VAADYDADQVLAFRVAGHHLDRRVGAEEAVAAIGLQEYPPGWGALAALRARSLEAMPADVVQVNSFRGSPYVVPSADVRVFTAALVPSDEAGLRALVGSATSKEAGEEGFGVGEALSLVAAAARDGLAAGPLGRDDFHQALRERLPAGLLPWCRGCQSHHVRPGFWRALGPLEVTVMPEKATWALASPPSMSLEDARAELVRRFLRVYGPASPSDLASWAQTGSAHAKQLFEGVADELVPAAVEGRRGFVLGSDVARLESPPPASGVRLLGGYDPWVAQPDRSSLVGGDDALRKKLFPSVGRPGVVLVNGVMAGIWKGRKQGATLELSVDWLGPEADIAEEAAAIASLRGCVEARPV
jgi:Winged helix DNA-binding domain